MSIKKYILKIYYDAETQEIIHLSEHFSDEDECRLIIDDEEYEMPKEMQECMREMDSDEIGIS